MKTKTNPIHGILDRFELDWEFRKLATAGATRKQINDCERILRHRFPEDYKVFLERFGSVEWAKLTIFGLGAGIPEIEMVDMIAAEEHLSDSLQLPLELIPIMGDGTGNFYCLRVKQRPQKVCPVVFWDHDHPKGSEQKPKIVARSFGNWLLRLMKTRFGG